MRAAVPPVEYIDVGDESPTANAIFGFGFAAFDDKPAIFRIGLALLRRKMVEQQLSGPIGRRYKTPLVFALLLHPLLDETLAICGDEFARLDLAKQPRSFLVIMLCERNAI